ncbi:uncharacterized protein LOC129718941 [Wyeomyia smithii]|uniref:uncharacterized protein LOC129718941 n=1 Tax=Wyeomyia smithii TaxID=174621 RepID=UPI0024681C98|nr:uncharacterized protein LOC129718941 [Wyeomyia smithii]
MDGKLIAKVRARPLLWHAAKGIKGTTFARHAALWDEVAAELRVQKEDARRRWRTLRDTFTRHYKTGTDWEHRQSMMFLVLEKPNIKPLRKRRSEVKSKNNPKLELIPSVQNDAPVEALKDGERSVPVSSGDDDDYVVKPKIKINFIPAEPAPAVAHAEIGITQGGDQSVEKSQESEP